MSDITETSWKEIFTNRRSARQFAPGIIPRERILELLALAHTSPSGFNLQPWHFVVVDDPAILKRLQIAALNQQQIGSAGAVVAVLVDRFAWQKPYDRVLTLWRDHGLPNAASTRFRRLVSLHFITGPLGVIGFAKCCGAAVAAMIRPMPRLLRSKVETDAYLIKQTMITVQTLLLAARAAGLASCPMEGFDEGRVRRVLGVPKRYRIAVLVALGEPAIGDTSTRSVRVPLEERVNFNSFGTV